MIILRKLFCSPTGLFGFYKSRKIFKQIEKDDKIQKKNYLSSKETMMSNEITFSMIATTQFFCVKKV